MTRTNKTRTPKTASSANKARAGKDRRRPTRSKPSEESGVDPRSNPRANPQWPWVQGAVAQVLKECGGEGATVSEIVVEVSEGLRAAQTGAASPGHGDAESLVRAALGELLGRGEAVDEKDRWFDPESQGLRRGRVERTGARFFRVRDLGLSEPTFFEVEARRLTGAQQGDVVLFKSSRVSQSRAQRDDRRARDRGAQGRASIKRVVSKRPNRWVGLLLIGEYGLEFQPFDHRLRFDARELDLSFTRDAEALANIDLRKGVYCSVEVEANDGKAGRRGNRDDRSRGPRGQRGRGNAGRGRTDRSESRGGSLRVRQSTLQVLGLPSDPNIETAVVLAHFGITDRWPSAVRAEEQAVLRDEIPTGIAVSKPRGGAGRKDRGAQELGKASTRRDLRELVTFTIDGETARDFDDALSVEAEGSGTRLWVHIADVSHYVRPGSVIDTEARARGTSVYFADRAVHMLPEGLSEDLCSLRPNVDRHALTVEMVFDDEGNRSKTRCYPSLISSDARLTYTDVETHFEGKGTIKQRPVRSALARAETLANQLLDARDERGAFEIEQEVGAFTIGEDGKPTSYDSTPRLFAHRLIEEFMIQANVAVAELAAARLLNRHTGGPRVALEEPATFLFRRHDPPKPSAMEELTEQVSALGVRLPSAEISSVGDLADLLEAVEDGPLRSLVEGLLLRSLKRAFYTPGQSEHFALGLEAYCHFTSPIRRYPDLVNHRFLKAVLFDDARHVPTGGQWVGGEELAENLSDLERRAEQAEREQFRWRMVRWLKEREGEEFRCTLTSIQSFGMFAALAGLGVDGLIPFDEVPGGEAEITTEGVEVRVDGGAGHRAKRFRIGDSVDAVLLSADLVRRQLLLSLSVDPKRTKRSAPRKASPKRGPSKASGAGAKKSQGRSPRRDAPNEDRPTPGKKRPSRRRVGR